VHAIDFTPVKHSTFLNAKESSIHIGEGESLIPVGPWVVDDRPETLKEMWLWRRKKASYFFFDQIPSLESYTKYLSDGPIFTKQRILFLVAKDETIVGHLGLATHGQKPATIDNVIRGAGEGDPRMAGLMAKGLQAVISWAREIHGIEKFRLEVRSDNIKAIEFYEKCGFSITEVNRAVKNPGFSPKGPGNFEELNRIVMIRET
jgi:RimJ/RimL family protein N-acetyltransferase